MKRKALFRLFSLLALVVFIGKLNPAPTRIGVIRQLTAQPGFRAGSAGRSLLPATMSRLNLRSVSPAQPAEQRGVIPT